jgi:hypothetical protein
MTACIAPALPVIEYETHYFLDDFFAATAAPDMVNKYYGTPTPEGDRAWKEISSRTYTGVL